MKSRLITIIVAVLMAFGVMMMGSVHAQTVVKTVGVGDAPWLLGVNQDTNMTYVANEFDDTVSVIDGASKTVVKTVGVGDAPMGVGVNPDINMIYVTNSGDDTVSVINGASNTVVKTVGVGDYPLGVDVNPGTKKVYVANNDDCTVSVINGASNTVVDTISVGNQPWGVCVNPDTNMIYVANCLASNVSVIDGSSNTVVKTVSVGTHPRDINVNPDTNMVYAANRLSDNVSVIDGSSNTVVKTVSVGNEPWGVGVDPDTNMIYVANSEDDTVSVIDGSSNTVVKTVGVGGYPLGVDVNPDTKKVYVANHGDDTVSVIGVPETGDTEYYAVIIGAPWDERLPLRWVSWSTQWFKNKLAYSSNNWKADNIKLRRGSLNPLADEGPTWNKEDVISDIEDLKGRMDRNDVFLFYFLGHGGSFSSNNEGYIKLNTSELFDGGELSELLTGDFPTDNVVVIISACHSGAFFNDLNANYFNVMTSCEQDELSDGTFFADGLLNGLTLGSADNSHGNGDGWVSTEELYKSTYQYTRGWIEFWNLVKDVVEDFHPDFKTYGHKDPFNIFNSKFGKFFAEGTTRSDFTEYLCFQNANEEDEEVTITCMMGESGSGENVVHEQTIPAETRVTLNVADIVGPDKDVSVTVESEGKQINIERPMYFNYQGKWSGGHVASGMSTPSSTFYFAEGTTRNGFDQYICLQNPNDEDTNATITYMLGTGETQEQVVLLPKTSRVTVKPLDIVGPEQDVSTYIGSDLPIVAERATYFDYNGVWAGGHATTGLVMPSNVFFFPEGTTRSGFDQYICLQNPSSEDTEATLTYMISTGENVEQKVNVPKTSRVTVKPVDLLGPEKDMSTMVICNDLIVAERPIYFAYQGTTCGGHVSPGSTFPSTLLSFAEGTTRAGFDEYICLQNPNDEDAHATITYMLGTGENQSYEVIIPKKSRLTVKPIDTVGPEQDVSTKIESTVPLIAERPMYFNNGSWIGGHCCLATTE